MFKDSTNRKLSIAIGAWILLMIGGLTMDYYQGNLQAAESPADTPSISFEMAVNSLPAEITGPATTVRIDWSDSRTLVNNPLTGQIEPAPIIQKQMRQYFELKQKVHNANSLWYYFLSQDLISQKK